MRRVLTAVRRARGRFRSSRASLAAAVVLLAGVITFAVPRLPTLSVRWSWLAVAAGLSLLTNALNMVEFRFCTNLLRATMSWRETMRVTIVASATNLLPVPGALLVKLHKLRSVDVPTAEAAMILALTGFLWSACALVVAGIVGIASGFEASSQMMLAAGSLAGLSTLAALYVGTERGGWLPALVVVELVTVVVTGGRFVCVVAGIGLAGTPLDGAVFVVADVLTSAIGLFPGGLGLREALVGLLGPWMDLDASVGVAATIADRVLTVAVLLGLGLALLGRLPTRMVGRRQPERRKPDAT